MRKKELQIYTPILDEYYFWLLRVKSKKVPDKLIEIMELMYKNKNELHLSCLFLAEKTNIKTKDINYYINRYMGVQPTVMIDLMRVLNALYFFLQVMK